MNNGAEPAGRPAAVASVGFLMLETRFPRPLGDVGNPQTWSFPVRYRVVRGASPQRIVRDGDRALLRPFIRAAAELEREGVAGIATSCGFLSLFQRELAAATRVPVASSSLLQIPLIERLLPARQRVGVITVAAAHLDASHLLAAGADAQTPVVGIDGGRELSRVLLDDEPTLDVELARADVIDAGRELVARHPQVGAVLLECTNMCPYRSALSRELALPVYDMVSFVRWFQSGLRPPER